MREKRFSLHQVFFNISLYKYLLTARKILIHDKILINELKNRFFDEMICINCVLDTLGNEL